MLASIRPYLCPDRTNPGRSDPIAVPSTVDASPQLLSATVTRKEPAGEQQQHHADGPRTAFIPTYTCLEAN